MNKHQSFTTGRIRAVSKTMASLVLMSILTPAATAGWSPTLEGRKILATGNNLLVGSLKNDETGGVIAAVETTGEAPGTKMLIAPRFDIDGNIVWNGLEAIYPWEGVNRTVRVFQPGEGEINYSFLVGSTAATFDDPKDHTQYTSTPPNNGVFSETTTLAPSCEAAVADAVGNMCVAFYDPESRTVGAATRLVESTYTPLSTGMAKDFFGAAKTEALGAVFSYTRFSQYDETASEIYVYSMNGQTPPTISALKKVADQATESQSNSKLAAVPGGQFMINWIGTLNGNTTLYAKLIDSNGDSVGPARDVAPDVTDYVTAPSNFGFPLFAYVQQNNDVTPPTKSLFAGLVDPTNGLSLILPVATAATVKVKTIRQEPSGEVTLVYSIPVGATNILKARRYSTAGIVLWETDVADLGTATDEKIEAYPNTFVAPGTDSALYFLTRRDTLNSPVTEFSLARLRPDGKLGNEAIPAPTGLGTTIIAVGEVSLAWFDNATNETSYVVVRIASNAPGFAIIATLPADTVNYTDTTAIAGVQYHYMIAAQRLETGEYSLSDMLPVLIAP